MVVTTAQISLWMNSFEVHEQFEMNAENHSLIGSEQAYRLAGQIKVVGGF